MASAWFYLSFAKPNLIVNTDLLIILCNYFSLIFKAEILFPPQLYLKRFILYGQSLTPVELAVNHLKRFGVKLAFEIPKLINFFSGFAGKGLFTFNVISKLTYMGLKL